METLKTILLILVLTVIFSARCFFQEKDTNIYFKSENSCVAPDNSEEACYLKK